MRLDHLLSKEPSACLLWVGPSIVCHGPPVVVGGGGRWLWRRGWLWDTLLGPEGTNPTPPVQGAFPGSGGGCVFWMVICALVAKLVRRWSALVGSGWVVAVGCGWLFVENCTVDASIFVVKLVRAHGGCLGTRSR